MKVFVTGHKGYIGVHLVDLLKQAGHTVTGCDIDLFSGCHWEEFARPDTELIEDIRSLGTDRVAGHDCVIHLAAISNDPMGDIDRTVTASINCDGALHVAEISKQAGIARFLFAGSCSIYGKGASLDLDEAAELNPVSAYALAKTEAEKRISELADKDFSPVFLRNATAYGHSPMLRIDLVANNLLACAFTSGDIRILSDGTPWRPLIHARDIARAFVAFMHAPRDAIHNQAVNVGANSENYQVKDVADKVKHLIPNANIVYTGEVGHDPRDYRVKFDLLNRLLPDFRLEYTLDKGLEELLDKFRQHEFSLEDFRGDQFVRLRVLNSRFGLLGKQV